MTVKKQSRLKLKSMRCSPSRRPACIVAALLLVVFSLSGCARPPSPWTESLDEDQRRLAEQRFIASASSRADCGPAWDADLSVTWSAPVRSVSFSAYCQVLAPSYLKIIASDPLGLPLLAVATNGTTYQQLDVTKKTSIYGSLRSWAVSNDLPLQLVKNWPDWLQGMPTIAPSRITEVRLDGQQRGVWLSISREGNEAVTEEYILFDQAEARILERMIVDALGEVRGVISYRQWQRTNGCLRPVHISISGLPYGAAAELIFSDIRETELTPEDFKLTIPPSFQKILMP